MAEIKVGKNESLDAALRRFKKQCQGIIGEIRKREHYDKPSIRRKKKAIAAKRRRTR
ncbi:MAG: 30S ribosomal protein S21 [Firmicutes bacterium]|nr:30S ribosomal protein S21 [Bacillota bacterium]